MSTLHEAAQQALEALEFAPGYSMRRSDAIDALSAALAADDGMCGARALARAYENGWNAAKAEQALEPVAWLWEHQLNDLKHYGYRPDMRAWTTEKRLGSFEGLVPLYTAPLQRKPLSDEDIKKAYRHIYRNLSYEFDHSIASWVEQGIRYAELAHGIGGSNE